LENNNLAYAIMLPGILAIFMALLIKFSALLAMPYHAPWWPADWRRIFNRLYPQMHFRIFILLGLWGKLGFVISASTGQTAENIDATSKAIRNNAKIRQIRTNRQYFAGLEKKGVRRTYTDSGKDHSHFAGK
jgi:hypothetical protein